MFSVCNRLLGLLVMWLLSLFALGQSSPVAVLPTPSRDTTKQVKATAPKPYKAEIFTNGFIDIVNNGQVAASARVVRLYVGEPGGWALPLSLYSGVAANAFQGGSGSGGLLRSNDHLVNQYINPLSGLVNISSDGVHFFKKTTKATRAGLLYHLGARVLTGIRVGPVSDPLTGKPHNFVTSFATTGLYMQTGAWERTNSSNVGIFWAAVRYHASKASAQSIKEFLPDIKTTGFYHGYSVGLGVEINNVVNLKAIYYKYLREPAIEYSLPIYQFSFNYSMK